MTKDEMITGLQAGRTLIQEEWAAHEEVQCVDELVDEGVATATAWEWRDNFQCRRRIIRAKTTAEVPA